jgi:hypothetical protein
MTTTDTDGGTESRFTDHGMRPRRRARGGDGPPARPRAFTPAELRFTPQPATRWFAPATLAHTGLREGVTSVFGSFLDKRELQSSHPSRVDTTLTERDDLWIDYVADTGDGFAATSTVAHHVARPHLELDVDGTSQRLPRGHLLVFGGDQVYPTASSEAYKDHFEGPWRAALPWTPPKDPDDPAHPVLYALPGNHDWYDGLTGFLRMFGQGRWIGGWRTRQTRSYFAVKLPHRWWLWGLDIQSESLIDDPQLEYFTFVARHHAERGDRIVLATPVPTWTQLERKPEAFENLAYFERTVIRPHGLLLPLTLAGDMHHYARYEREDAPLDGEGGTGGSHRITAGGGGAFLHPTHDLPRTTTLTIDPEGPRTDDGRSAPVRERYGLQTCYPRRRTSRWLSLSALALPVRNWTFLFVPGVVSLLVLWTVQFGLRTLEDPGVSFADASGSWGWTDAMGGVARNSLSLAMALALWGGLFAFAKPPPRVHARWTRALARAGLSLVHLLAQLSAIAAVGVAAVRLAEQVPGDGWEYALTAGAAALVLGAVVGSLVVGLYLAAAIGLPGLRTHGNEAFSASRITRYKSFLRLHVERDRLTVYAIAVPRAVKRRHWRVPTEESQAAEAADPSAPLIEPTREPVAVRLIEAIEIPGSTAPASAD